MIARVFFPIFTLLVLFQAGSADPDTSKSPSACHCSPVINVGATGNGQCDLCEVNNQLLQAVKDLKKELGEIKSQISQMKPGVQGQMNCPGIQLPEGSNGTCALSENCTKLTCTAPPDNTGHFGHMVLTVQANGCSQPLTATVNLDSSQLSSKLSHTFRDGEKAELHMQTSAGSPDIKLFLKAELEKNDGKVQFKLLLLFESPYVTYNVTFLEGELGASGCGLPPRPSFDLSFSKMGTTDYVIHHGLQVTTAFTICFRARTQRHLANDGTILSYSTSQAFNEILIKDVASLELWINDEYKSTGVPVNDGKWHHICVSWGSMAGNWDVYKDGVNKVSWNKGFQSAHDIRTDGILVIGQDQDSLGGGFTLAQSYMGELTDLNIWDRKLNATEVLNLSKLCNGGEGNVKKWSDFKVGIKGNVRVVSPSNCKI